MTLGVSSGGWEQRETFQCISFCAFHILCECIAYSKKNKPKVKENQILNEPLL